MGGPGAVVEVSDAPYGSARIEDGQLVVDIPEGAEDAYVLTLTIERAGIQVREEVVISPLAELVSVDLDDSASSIAVETQAGAEIDSVADSESADETAASPIDRIAPTLAAPPALLGLQALELPIFELAMASLASVVAVLLGRRYFARRTYLAVDRTPRSSVADATLPDGRFQLRHNARGIWSSGRVRGDEIEVETPNGKAWVPREHLARELD